VFDWRFNWCRVATLERAFTINELSSETLFLATTKKLRKHLRCLKTIESIE